MTDEAAIDKAMSRYNKWLSEQSPEKLRARISELEAALKPFADHADKINHELISAKTVFEARKGHTLYYGDFRAARAALNGGKDG